MRAFVDSILNSVKEFFKGLTKPQRIRLAVLAAVILVLGITVAVILGRTNYVTLYSGLSAEEAGQILTALQEMGEDAKPQGSGTILVPEGRVSELRMKLSAEGYQAGGFDTSIMDQASGFGMTDMEKRTYYQYQKQAHIRTMILMMSKISDCLVTINLPEESPFVLSQGSSVASAAVMLEIKGGGKLTQDEVNAIAETVINGVPGLEYEKITIVDSNMNSYAPGAGGDAGSSMASQLAMESQVQTDLEEQVVNLLTPVFGRDAIRASVGVTLNFDDVRSEAIVFEPPIAGSEEGIIVSMSELYESSRTDDAAIGIPGTDSNGMGTVEYPYGTLADGEIYSKVLREMNYEINQTTTQIQRAKGTISSLSIAVLIDSKAVAQDYTQTVQNLVAQALGIKVAYVTVERLPFEFNSSTISELLDAQNSFMKSVEFRAMIKNIIVWIIILIIIMLILLFIRSIVRTVHPAPELAYAGAVGAVGAIGGQVDYMAEDEMEDDSALALQEIALGAKSESVANLEKFIEKDPAAVAQLLRNWLLDD